MGRKSRSNLTASRGPVMSKHKAHGGIGSPSAPSIKTKFNTTKKKSRDSTQKSLTNSADHVKMNITPVKLAYQAHQKPAKVYTPTQTIASDSENDYIEKSPQAAISSSLSPRSPAGPSRRTKNCRGPINYPRKIVTLPVTPEKLARIGNGPVSSITTPLKTNWEEYPHEHPYKKLMLKFTTKPKKTICDPFVEEKGIQPESPIEHHDTNTNAICGSEKTMAALTLEPNNEIKDAMEFDDDKSDENVFYEKIYAEDDVDEAMVKSAFNSTVTAEEKDDGMTDVEIEGEKVYDGDVDDEGMVNNSMVESAFKSAVTAEEEDDDMSDVEIEDDFVQTYKSPEPEQNAQPHTAICKTSEPEQDTRLNASINSFRMDVVKKTEKIPVEQQASILKNLHDAHQAKLHNILEANRFFVHTVVSVKCANGNGYFDVWLWRLANAYTSFLNDLRKMQKFLDTV